MWLGERWKSQCVSLLSGGLRVADWTRKSKDLYRRGHSGSLRQEQHCIYEILPLPFYPMNLDIFQGSRIAAKGCCHQPCTFPAAQKNCKGDPRGIQTERKKYFHSWAGDIFSSSCLSSIFILSITVSMALLIKHS